MARKKQLSDYAHDETDKIIKRMEKKVSKEYSRAVKETTKKLDEHVKSFTQLSKEKLKLVSEGKLTEKEYRKWLSEQMLVGKRWINMRNALAQDFYNADKIAKSIIKGYMPEVYALNHNYATYKIEQGIGASTSYTLYSREAAERILRKNPKILSPPGAELRRKIAEGKAIKWQAGRIQSAALQAILQGESIPKIAKRICSTVGASDAASAMRYARTAMTGAENAGRMDAYHRAEEMGVEMQKTWIATIDNRTRHAHAELDGQTVDVDEPFVNSIGEILYPGDPDADDANIWNCRCSMISSIKGFEIDTTNSDVREMSGLEDMTYNEWKEMVGK